MRVLTHPLEWARLGPTQDTSTAATLAPSELFAWPAVAGVSFHAAYAWPEASLLILLYLFSLAQLARAGSPRQAFYSGLAAGLFVGAPRLAFFWTIFSGGAAILWLVFAFWIAAFVALGRICLRRLRPPYGWLLFPALWTGLEFFRSELYYLRFAWLTPGYAFADHPGLPGTLGVYGAGFALMAVAVLASLPQAFPFKLLALTTGAAVILAGSALVQAPPPATNGIQVTGIQMEFPTEAEVLRRLNDAIREAPSTELVVLSEYTFTEPVPASIKAWCERNRKFLLLGVTEPAPGGRFYNTACVVDPQGQIAFRQVKGVPIQFFKDGLPAPEQKLWESPWGRIGICVCYDLSYTRITDALARAGAQALIVPTMDVADWGRAQHELHARVTPVRAAEHQVPIFRLASSGISQISDGTGRVLASAPFPGEGAVLRGELEMGAPAVVPPDRLLARVCAATAGMVAFLALVRTRRPARPETVSNGTA